MSLVILATTSALLVAALLLAYRAKTFTRPLLAYGTSAFVAFISATAIWKQLPDSAADADPVSAGLSAGYMDFSTRPGATAASPVRANEQRLPSVPAMIAQLEARLDAEPADAKGWSLLAKSYAYVGNESGTETAISNAVQLGIDESALRSQVTAVSGDR